MASQQQSKLQRTSAIALTIALILGLVLCFFIALPFLPALVWSATLAVLFAPVERVLRKAIKMRCLSLAVTLILAAVAVVAPILLVSSALVGEIVDSANTMAAMLTAEFWSGLANRSPMLAPTIGWVTQTIDLQQLLQTAATRLGNEGASLIQGSIVGMINLLLTFYFLFYLLRDRTSVLAVLERNLPLTSEEFATLLDRIVRTIFASAYGIAAVAALQGFLGGLIFWWLGLPSPVFWGVIMGMLAIVPFLGAFVIWVPFSIALALDGQYLSAASLALWGTLVVGLVDNIVYPILVGRQIVMHSMVSFIAIVGGLLMFGPHGIVLGPVIVAAVVTLLKIWRARRELDLR